ncbi:MAG: hypothetical protein KA841_07950 [Chitinophagales bacterium]|jgi:hypothetical protein|nr:hypothetical protein [Chitinophagales bacterium]
MNRFWSLFVSTFVLKTGLLAQWSPVDFNEVDSLIESTHSIDLCLVDGKEDLRFFSKTPEKYADFKLIFFNQAKGALTYADSSRFKCDITVEINCEGKAGNFVFGIEPRMFYEDEMKTFRQLIQLVGSVKDYSYTPATYLGKQVNSKAKFKLLVKEGKLYME